MLQALRKIIHKDSPNLDFLSETRLEGFWAERIKRQVGFPCSFHIDCKGMSGGLLLLWKEEWDVTIGSCSSGHVDATMIDEVGR